MILLDRIIRFYHQVGWYKHHTLDLIKAIKEHIKQGTIEVILDGDDVIAVCRYNIYPSGRVCHIIDLVVQEGHDIKSIIRNIIVGGLAKWPSVKWVRWERGIKHPNRRLAIYKTSDLNRGRGEGKMNGWEIRRDNRYSTNASSSTEYS